MKIAATLEETLEGGFKGLYGEVVTYDTYRLRGLPFVPDVVFDIGANIGVFTRYVHELFPSALIVAVEPDPSNCAHFRKFTTFPNVMLLEAALGRGKIYHGLTAANGTGETYLSAGLGYPADAMSSQAKEKKVIEECPVASFSLDQLVYFFTPPQRVVLKIDCEGAENSIWRDSASMAMLRSVDYLAMEIHRYALTGAEQDEVNRVTEEALTSLEETHFCERDGVHFWALKKEYGNQIPKRIV